MTVDDLKLLDQLLRASTFWAVHIFFVAIGVLALILTQSSWPSALFTATMMNIFIGYAFLCLIVSFALLWLRNRFRMTIRLKNLIHYDTLIVRDAAITRIRFFFFIPLGHELEVNLVGGEHLTFGFWSEMAAHQLHDLLVKAHRVAVEKKQLIGFEES